MDDDAGAPLPPQNPALEGAASLLRIAGWVEILFQLVLVALPGGIILLIFGAPLVAAPIAAGIAGLRFAKALRAGHRLVASAVFGFLHGFVMLALGAYSTTWDRGDEEGFYRLLTFTFVLLGGATVLAGVLTVSGRRRRTATPEHDGLELRPALWPWLAGAGLLLLLSLLGTAVSGSS